MPPPTASVHRSPMTVPLGEQQVPGQPDGCDGCHPAGPWGPGSEREPLATLLLCPCPGASVGLLTPGSDPAHFRHTPESSVTQASASPFSMPVPCCASCPGPGQFSPRHVPRLCSESPLPARPEAHCTSACWVSPRPFSCLLSCHLVCIICPRGCVRGRGFYCPATSAALSWGPCRAPRVQ